MTDVQDKFDLQESVDSLNLTVERVNGLAQDLEQAEGINPEDMESEELADLVHALKRLESATEDARKDVFEEELNTRVAEGETIRQLSKQRGKHTYVEDTEGAFSAVAESGNDPMDVASVSISDLRDVLGSKANDYIGENTYTYFKRTQ